MTEEKHAVQMWVDEDMEAYPSPIATTQKLTHMIEYSEYQLRLNDVEFWKKDSGAAWDKCEQFRLDNINLKNQLDQFNEHFNGKANRITVGKLMIENKKLNLRLKRMRIKLFGAFIALCNVRRLSSVNPRARSIYHTVSVALEKFKPMDKKK